MVTHHRQACPMPLTLTLTLILTLSTSPDSSLCEQVAGPVPLSPFERVFAAPSLPAIQSVPTQPWTRSRRMGGEPGRPPLSGQSGSASGCAQTPHVLHRTNPMRQRPQPVQLESS
jgi:hypothetical protein